MSWPPKPQHRENSLDLLSDEKPVTLSLVLETTFSNSRNFMNTISSSFGLVLKIGGAAIVFLQFLVVTLSAAEPIAKPNIIFVMADDLGYGDLGCYGQQVIKTPHIDQLAANGLRFTQCYAGSTVCAPSRSVLMTGKHTGHTTVRGNFGTGGVDGLGGGKGRVPLNKHDVTVAEILKQAGYVTGMTGK